MADADSGRTSTDARTEARFTIAVASTASVWPERPALVRFRRSSLGRGIIGVTEVRGEGLRLRSRRPEPKYDDANARHERLDLCATYIYVTRICPDDREARCALYANFSRFNPPPKRRG